VDDNDSARRSHAKPRHALSRDWRSQVRQHITLGFHSMHTRVRSYSWSGGPYDTIQLLYCGDNAAACIRLIRGQNCVTENMDEIDPCQSACRMSSPLPDCNYSIPDPSTLRKTPGPAEAIPGPPRTVGRVGHGPPPVQTLVRLRGVWSQLPGASLPNLQIPHRAGRTHFRLTGSERARGQHSQVFSWQGAIRVSTLAIPRLIQTQRATPNASNNRYIFGRPSNS
jgi:hypothetical protein